MNAIEGLERITFDSGVMAGRAYIRGLRIPVSLILRLIADGLSRKKILEEYPDLEDEDIRQCLEYAAWLASEETVALDRVAG